MTSRVQWIAAVAAGGLLLWCGLWLIRRETPERAFAEFDSAMRAGRYEDAARRVSQREVDVIWGSRKQFVSFCRSVLPKSSVLAEVRPRVEPLKDTSRNQLQLYPSDSGRPVTIFDGRRSTTAMLWREPDGRWGVSAQPYIHFAAGLQITRPNFYRRLYDGLVVAKIPRYVHDGVMGAKTAPRDELLRVASGEIAYIDDVTVPLNEENDGAEK